MKKYGLLTVTEYQKICRSLNSSGQTLRVYLDGNDVTDRCYEVSDVEGYVKMYRLRNGKPYLVFGDPRECVNNEFHRPARETAYGSVEIRTVDKN